MLERLRLRVLPRGGCRHELTHQPPTSAPFTCGSYGGAGLTGPLWRKWAATRSCLTHVNDRRPVLNDHLLCCQKKSAAAAAAMTSDLGYPPDLEPAIKDELAVLASIEARYADELARLERSGSQSSAKAHLRKQLDLRRNSAREPHVLRLADLHEQMLQSTLWRGGTRH